MFVLNPSTLNISPLSYSSITFILMLESKYVDLIYLIWSTYLALLIFEDDIHNLIYELSNISGGSSYGGLLEYIKELTKSRSGGSDLISHIESLRNEYNSSQNSNPLTPIGIQ